MTDTIPRGATPHLVFALSIDTEKCTALDCTIESGNDELHFGLSDMILGDGTVWLPLTQEQTTQLKSWVRIQFKAVIDGKVLVSKVVEQRVSELLNEEVMDVG